MTRFPDAPANIAALPVEERGYPVPWFTPWIKGKPEFRAVDPARAAKAHKENRCWICGKPLGSVKAFVIGPMCMINRLSVEPPSHLQCARFAVVACPFLSRPLAKRGSVDDLPHAQPPGIMIERNPGVSLIWVTQSYRVERQDGGLLFRIGAPTKTEWWAQGRPATRDEVIDSISSGVPLLANHCATHEERVALLTAVQRSVKFLPAEEDAPVAAQID